MKLTNRLCCIASKVPNGAKVADIGTDHAYVPVFLVQNNISSKVIASDINIGPLKRAQKHIKDSGVENFIETRLGPGLQILKSNEADTIIIAGMGGMLIRDILSEAEGVLNSVRTLILQPMIAQEVLREWLYNNNFKIVDEALSREEDKIYTVIVAEHGFEVVDEIYYDIGKKLIEKKDSLLTEYLEKKINEINKVLRYLGGQQTKNTIQREKECQDKLNKYTEILNMVNAK